MLKCGTFTSLRGSAVVRRIVAVGIAVLFVVTLTEGCRKTTTGNQNPPAIQTKQPIQQLSSQWQQEEIKRWLQAKQQQQSLQELLQRMAQAQQQELQLRQAQSIRQAQEQQRLWELQMLEWSRNYFLTQIYPRIKESSSYLLAQLELLSLAIDNRNYLLLRQIATNDITFLINFGVPTNFYPPRARDLLLSAEADFKRISMNNQDIAAKILNGTVFYNPAEATVWLYNNKSYFLSAAQKIVAAEQMLGLPPMPP